MGRSARMAGKVLALTMHKAAGKGMLRGAAHSWRDLHSRRHAVGGPPAPLPRWTGSRGARTGRLQVAVEEMAR